jgi:chemotaxis protein histidine kinase CheA
MHRESTVISEEDGPILEQFINESSARMRELLPQVRQLVAEPEREDLQRRVIDDGHRLFQILRTTGAFLQLEHLIAPAEAMATLLGTMHSTASNFSPRHIALVAETCTFVEQGLALVAREQNDKRLAAAATGLQGAILELVDDGREFAHERIPFLGISAEMREAFLQECEHLLMTAEQECVLWDFIAVDHQRVAELCRLLHRLQQNFSLYECGDFERLCMALESTLNRYLQGEFFQTEYPERVLLRCIDAMREGLARYGLSEELVVTDAHEHLQSVRGLIRQPLGVLLVEAGLVDPRTVDEALTVQRCSHGEQSPRLGEVLVAMGEVSREQVEQILKTQQCQVDTVQPKSTDPNSATAVRASVPLFPREIKIDGQKMARIVSVVRQMAALPLSPELTPFVSELERLTRNCGLETATGLLHFYQRMVHDEAMQRNKRILFQAEGLEILQDELDVSLCADLIVPLLRNGIEHGVEDVGLRQALGKKKHGRLSLSALRQGNELWISIEDDGHGFDLRKITTLCLDQGLVGREELGRMTGAELLQIFLHNQGCLSVRVDCAATVRCTGLASVKTLLRDIHGKMDIWSRPHKGSRITLRLTRCC